MNPSTAIIIVTYNGSRYIKNCLTSIFFNDYRDFVVYIVDNNSPDDTVNIIADNFPQVRLIKSPENSGFVGGNNLALQEALKENFSYFVLLNQDTEVEAGWLRHLVKAVEGDKEIGICQSLLVLGKERGLLNNFGNAWHFLGFGFVKDYRRPLSSLLDSAPREIGYASGAAMLIRREVLEKIGRFDEKFFSYHEDLDLCWRARLVGYKIKIAPQARVYHYYEFNRSRNLFYWTERNRLLAVLQNYSFKTLLLLAPAFLSLEIVMFVYCLISGNLLAKLKSYLGILLNLGKIYRARRAIQKSRVISDSEIFAGMDYRLEFPGGRMKILDYLINPFLSVFYKFAKPLI